MSGEWSEVAPLCKTKNQCGSSQVQKGSLETGFCCACGLVSFWPMHCCHEVDYPAPHPAPQQSPFYPPKITLQWAIMERKAPQRSLGGWRGHNAEDYRRTQGGWDWHLETCLCTCTCTCTKISSSIAEGWKFLSLSADVPLSMRRALARCSHQT